MSFSTPILSRLKSYHVTYIVCLMRGILDNLSERGRKMSSEIIVAPNICNITIALKFVK
jgi:hypothetical protein